MILLGGLALGVLATLIVLSIQREAKRQTADYARVKKDPASIGAWRIQELRGWDVNVFDLEVRFKARDDWSCIASGICAKSLVQEASALGLALRPN